MWEASLTHSLTHSLQPGEARIADEREKGFNSNLPIFIFFFPFTKGGFYSRSFPNISLSSCALESMLAPAPAAVIAAGEEEGREGFTIQHQKRCYRTSYPASEEEWRGGTLGSRNLDSWTMTRRFFYIIHASGLFVNTGFLYGLIRSFSLFFLFGIGGGGWVLGGWGMILIGGWASGMAS